MRNFALGLGCAAMLGMANSSFAAVGVVFEDGFDYGSQGAYESVWVGGNATLVSEWDPDYDALTDNNIVENAVYTPGGFDDIMTLASAIVPTTDEWIKLTIDIWDDDSDLAPSPLASGNKRLTFGMRNAASPNIIEMGIYNSPGHYAYRAQLFDVVNGQTNPNWVAYDLGYSNPSFPSILNTFEADWHQFIVTIKPDGLVFEFDKNRDGTIDRTDEYTNILPQAVGFDQLRIGSPSNLTNGGGGAFFDNVRLEIIAASAPSIPGDLDGDGYVGITDLNIVLGNWDKDIPPGDERADPSGDDFVGIEDLNIVLANWDSGTPPASVVPEPTTLALLSLGGLAMLRRR